MLVVLVVTLGFVGTAKAEEDGTVQAVAWGVAGAEVATAGYVWLKFGPEVLPADGTGGALVANLIPAVIGGGLALAAHHWDFDNTPALAAHGAVWAGLDLMMIGAVLDDRGRGDEARLGKAAVILGAIGAVGGGVLGATLGDRAPEAWLVAPTAGVACGALAGGMWMLLTGLGEDGSFAKFTLGLAGGLTAGIATAAIYAATTDEPVATPRVTADHDRVVVSFGGAF